VRARGLVRRGDVERVLARPPKEPYDLAFLDPPYARGLGFVARILGKLASGATRSKAGREPENGWIRAGGTVVVESVMGAIPWPEGFHQTRVRPFGRTQVAVAVREDDA